MKGQLQLTLKRERDSSFAKNLHFFKLMNDWPKVETLAYCNGGKSRHGALRSSGLLFQNSEAQGGKRLSKVTKEILGGVRTQPILQI